MITKSTLRFIGAVLLGLVGLGMASGSGGGFGIVLVAIAFVWGVIELFLLSALLLLYGVSGIVHDIGATQDRDPWNRW